MYHVAVFDDNNDDLEGIASLTERLLERAGEEHRVDRFSTPAALESARHRGEHWDLLLLDILMDGPVGLRLAESLRAEGDETDLVFVTSCAEYALDGYRAYPVSYLVKPITRENLLPVLERCLFRCRQEPALTLSQGEGGAATVALKDIRYIEIFRREVVIHGGSRTVTGTGSLSALLEQLPLERFYRSHRSYVVNLDFVSGVQKYRFLLRDSGSVPIAMRTYPEAQQKWLDYVT